MTQVKRKCVCVCVCVRVYIYIHTAVSLVSLCKYLFKLVKGTIIYIYIKLQIKAVKNPKITLRIYIIFCFRNMMHLRQCLCRLVPFSAGTSVERRNNCRKNKIPNSITQRSRTRAGKPYDLNWTSNIFWLYATLTLNPPFSCEDETVGCATASRDISHCVQIKICKGPKSSSPLKRTVSKQLTNPTAQNSSSFISKSIKFSRDKSPPIEPT
jgi:hypothetical protein